MKDIVGTQSGISGHVDCCEGVQLGGWVWNAAEPEQRLEYFVHLDDVRHGPFIADQRRADLEAAGFGDGGYGFSLLLSELDPHYNYRSLSIEVDGSVLLLNTPSPTVRGSLDSLSGETLVGWVRDELAQDRSVVCRLELDGRDCGSVLANLDRPDLRAVGVGAGWYGYTIELGPLLRQHALNSSVGLRLSVASDGRPVPPFPLRYTRLMGQLLDGFNRDRTGLLAAAARLLAWAPPAEETTAPTGRLDAPGQPGRAWRPEVPVTAYLEHVVSQPGCPEGAGCATGGELLELVVWHLGQWQTGRPGTPLSFGDEVTAFLNAPQTLPGLRGRQLSRLMFRQWADVRADYDIFTEAGYFRFAGDWVARYIDAGVCGSELLPGFVCDALAEAHPDYVDLRWPLSRHAVERARRVGLSAGLKDDAARLNWLARYCFERLASAEAVPPVPGYMLEALRARVVEATELTAGTLLLAWAMRFLNADSDAQRVLPGAGWLEDALACRSAWPAGHPAWRLERARVEPAAGAPTATTAAGGGVTVIGATESSSGLGTQARDSLRALEAAGIAHSEIAFSPNDPAAPSVLPRLVRCGGADGAGRAVNIVHIQPDHLPEAVAAYGRGRWPAGYNVGSFAWELEQLPAAFQLGARMVDEIWLTTEFVCRAFRPLADVPVRPLGVAVQPAEPESGLERASLGFAEDDYLFCFVFDIFSWATRKNPLGLVEAFQRAFEGQSGVGLVLKVRNAQHAGAIGAAAARHWRAVLEAAAGDARIRIVDAEYSAAGLSALMQMCDCYVSLHRAEGFGYTMAEALYWGKPVLATGYSGNLDYTTAETAFLVDARPVYVPVNNYMFYTPGMQWGEPDLEHAVREMRLLARRPEEARRRAEAGRRLIRERYSVAALGERYGRWLAEIQGQVAGA